MVPWSGGLAFWLFSPNNQATGPFKLASLDISDGSYTNLFTVPLPDGTKNLAGAGISPIDAKLYATLRVPDNNAYLIRLDEDRVEFLEMLPYLDAVYSMGAFSSNGTFVVPRKGTTDVYFWTSAQLSAMTWHQDYNNAPAFTGSTLTLTTEIVGLDVTFAKGEYEAGLGEQEYGFVVKANRRIVMFNLDTGTTFDINPVNSNSFITTTSSFSSSWTFQNEVYVFHDGDGGIFRLQTTKLDLYSAAGPILEVTGPWDSDKINKRNNGLNCPWVHDPWATAAPTKTPTPAPTNFPTDTPTPNRHRHPTITPPCLLHSYTLLLHHRPLTPTFHLKIATTLPTEF